MTFKKSYLKVESFDLHLTLTYIFSIAGVSRDTDSAVQQSQVSSSKPALLPEDILGPLLLEVTMATKELLLKSVTIIFRNF